MQVSTRDYFIKDLFERVELSVRAYNICESLELITVRDLHNYIVKYGGFHNVRNCGRKTNLELLEFHKIYYIDSFDNNSESENENSEIINDAPVNDSSFNLLIKVEFEKLSVRAHNALLVFFENKAPDKKAIKEYFIDQTFYPKKLRNVGMKTVIEIEEFVKKAIDLYFKNINKQISPIELATIKLKEITGTEITETFYLDNYLNNNFPIIAFTAKYFNEIFGLNSVDGYIVKNHFHLFPEYLTLDEIGKKFNLTRERVRQKRETLSQKMTSQIDVLKQLIPHSKYQNVLREKNYISISEDIIEDEVRLEIEEVGELFSTFILSLLFNENYYSVTLLDKIERPEKVSRVENYKLYKSIRGNYLFKKELIKKTEILNVFKVVLDELSQIQEEDYLIPFTDLGIEYLTPELKVIISEFIESEFELGIKNDSILIPRNSLKRVFEFAQEALEKIGKPAHITEIVSVIKDSYPDFDSPDTAVKSAMGNHKDLFIYFGRSSTYGLKIWESKNQFVKGGTIRDIVEEFLEQYDEPCHTSAITQYVNKFRKTEEHSIVNNLKMSGDKRFVFLKDGYVGLVGKDYNAKDKGNVANEDISLDDLLKSIFNK